MNSKGYSLAIFLILTGCARFPIAPTIPVMPAPGKPFDLFVNEERECRRYADFTTGRTPHDAYTDSVVSDAAAGTAIGAIVGTGLGALSGHPGEGAIIGSGIGLVEGSAIGANEGYRSSYSMQQQYNIAYQQCMYAKGNQLPGAPVIYPPPLPPRPY